MRAFDFWPQAAIWALSVGVVGQAASQTLYGVGRLATCDTYAVCDDALGEVCRPAEGKQRVFHATNNVDSRADMVTWVETTYIRNPASQATEAQGFMPATLLPDAGWQAIIADLAAQRRPAQGIKDVLQMRFNDDAGPGITMDMWQFAPLGQGGLVKHWKISCPAPGG